MERSCRALIISIILLFFAAISHAVTYYVSPSGSDANDGLSEGLPKQSLATTIYSLHMGDTLVVLPGEYNLVNFRAWPKDPYKGLMYLNTSGGDKTQPVTIKGKNGVARPEINVFASDGVSPGSFQFNGVVGLNLEFLQINHGEIGYGSYINYKDIIFQGPGNNYGVHAEHHYSTIENCQFLDIYGGSDAIGIYITGLNNTIKNSFFKNITQHAINSNTWSGKASSGWLIEGNRITDCIGHGIGLQNLQNTIIRNNFISNVSSQSISLGGSVFPDSGVKIVGNTIYNADKTGLYGIYAFNGINDIVVENNIIVHPNPLTFNKASILEKENMLTYTFRNNIWKATSKTTIFMPDNDQANRLTLPEWQTYTANILENGVGLEQGSQVGLPGVVSPPTSGTDYLNYDGSGVNLHLASGGLAINSGVNSTYIYQDIVGDWRPQGATMDIGADEYLQSTGDTENPTPPTSLSSVTPTDGTVYNPLYNIARLSWGYSTDNIHVVGYRIYRNGSLVATVGGATTYDDIGLTAETTYSYYVVALDAAGNQSGASNTISHTVPETPPANTPPSAKFTYSYTATNNATPVVFNSSTSSAATGSLIKQYHWDFGDGTTQTVNVDLTGIDPETGAQPAVSSVSHAYPVIGYFSPILTVTDTFNRTASVSWNVRFKYTSPVTYYVSPSGSDLNDGLSESAPLKDLTKAIYRLYNGCTLIVLEGIYNIYDFRAWPSDQYKMQMYLDANGGDPVNKVTIKGKDGVLPKIIAYKSGSTGGTFQFNGIRGLELSNLSIWGEFGYGTNLHLHDLEFMGPGNSYGIHGALGSSTVERCYIHDIYGGSDAHGMYVTGDDITIRGNFFSAIGISAIHTNTNAGIASKRFLIEDNYMTNVSGHGISIFNVQDSVIRNNVLVNVKGQSLSIGGSAYPSSNNKFLGNTVYNAGTGGFTGMFISNDSTGLVFKNNLIIHNRPFGFTLARTPTQAIVSTWDVSNNLYYNYNEPTWTHYVDGGSRWSLAEYQAYTLGTLSVSGVEANSLNTSPVIDSPPVSFYDHILADGSDIIYLTPSQSSPLIGAGISDADLLDDVDGVSRSGGVDIGAYQYTGNPPLNPIWRGPADTSSCADTPALCIESACSPAGWYWCDGACQQEVCSVKPILPGSCSFDQSGTLTFDQDGSVGFEN